MGGKGKKNRRGQKTKGKGCRPFLIPQVTARLASLADIFAFSPPTTEPGPRLGKAKSVFLSLWVIFFPHIGMFSFLHRKCITLKKVVYDIKYINR